MAKVINIAIEIIVESKWLFSSSNVNLDKKNPLKIPIVVTHSFFISKDDLLISNIDECNSFISPFIISLFFLIICHFYL